MSAFGKNRKNIESLSAELAWEKKQRIQAEAEARKWKSRQRSTEQKLGYEEKLRGKAEAQLEWEGIFDRMLCQKQHQRIEYVGESCPLCAAGERIAELEAALARAEAKVEELEAELSAPWHVGAFIEVDGITVGPHKAREWLRRIRELEDKLAALRADRTEILDSAWNTAHERAETAEAVRREERDKRVLAEERQRVEDV